MNVETLDDRPSALDLMQTAFRASRRLNHLELVHEAWPAALWGQFTADPAEFLGRASGLSRAGVTAQLSWARRESRIGLGIETPIAHALVDRLLGDLRTPAESRLQVTPVEWGILSFLVLKLLGAVEPLLPIGSGPLDLSLDRLGTDPFDARDLGPIITVRWGVRVGSVAGAVRIWVPEQLVALADPHANASVPNGPWLALAGTISLSRGLDSLRTGRVLPIDAATLTGSPESPLGIVRLVSSEHGPGRYLEALPEAGAGGTILRITSNLIEEATSRRPLSPTRLDVVLGSLEESSNRMAPGAVVQLRTEADAPISLRHEGKVVARGHLVSIDTELGVKVTQLFG